MIMKRTDYFYRKDGISLYIHLGNSMAVRDCSIIGVFDLETCSWSNRTRQFLNAAEMQGQIVDVGEDLPKAFVLSEEFGMTRVYLTQLASATIEKRSRETVESQL